jgi:hypothetical protein
MGKPPDLQELVAKHGGYDKITAKGWAEFDRAMAEWQQWRREEIARERAEFLERTKETRRE